MKLPIDIRANQAGIDEVHHAIFGERIAKQQAHAQRLPAAPVDATDEELIKKACDASARFASLYRDGWQGDDQSAQDMWLCSRLAFWTGRDSARMDRIFRSSALMREKWNRADYREPTLTKAITECVETYDPKVRVRMDFTPDEKPKLRMVANIATNSKGAESKPKPKPAPKPPDLDPRPIVDYVGGLDLHIHSDQAWKHLVAKNNPPILYAHGHQIARIDRDQDSGRAYTVSCGRYELAHQLSACARFRGPKGKEDWQWTPPPHGLVHNLLVTPGKPLPPLLRLTHVPVFTHDGRLIDQPGYDGPSGIYYDPSGLTIDSIAAAPSDDQVLQARDLLLTPLREFPFVDRDADCATCLALMIERFARDLIRGCLPIYLFDAAKRGAGKGRAARACLYPALGGLINRPPAKNEEAAAKRLLAVLKEADELYMVDNQTRLLDSESLAAAVTTPYDGCYSDRLLGVTGSGTFPVRFTTVVTSNNARLSTDIWRRTPTHVRIVVKNECPEDREFECNLDEWLPAHRAEMIRAILILIQNWIVRGMPAWSGKKIGSFEQWCSVIGGILEAAHVAGFMSKYKERRAIHDDRALEEREFITAWFECHGDDAMTARDLVSLALPIDRFNLSRYAEPGDEELSLKKQAVALGRWLSASLGGVFGEFQIEAPKYIHGLKYYKLGPAR